MNVQRNNDPTNVRLRRKQTVNKKTTPCLTSVRERINNINTTIQIKGKVTNCMIKKVKKLFRKTNRINVKVDNMSCQSQKYFQF